MASEIPPTDYFNGITFNPDFYQSSSSDYITASTGKSYFLSYPIAQGTETILSALCRRHLALERSVVKREASFADFVSFFHFSSYEVSRRIALGFASFSSPIRVVQRAKAGEINFKSRTKVKTSHQ